VRPNYIERIRVIEPAVIVRPLALDSDAPTAIVAPLPATAASEILKYARGSLANAHERASVCDDYWRPAITVNYDAHVPETNSRKL
jgi:hypothetical protein